jgi:hypothetical protein
MRTASCSCGQLTATCEGEPIRVSLCHCLACQKRTGSVFGVVSRWPVEKVTVSGEATVWTRTGDEGHTARFRFCPVCGATVYYTFDGNPDVIAVTVGSFADPTFPGPEYTVYNVRRHAWAEMPALAGLNIYD